jgi:hypothetical protein
VEAVRHGVEQTEKAGQHDTEQQPEGISVPMRL